MSVLTEVIAAEHQARCDLIDALFYVYLVVGHYGPGITEGEKTIAAEFASKMLARYPMQKGRRFDIDGEAAK